MQDLFRIVIFSIVFTQLSCTDDTPPPPIPVETKDVDLVFKLSYDGEPLIMLDAYQFPSGEIMKFTRFSFFISDVKWKTVAGSTDQVDVDLLNFSTSHSTLEDAQEGFRYTLEGVPIDQQESLRFMIGVNPELNAQVPADYQAGHPLANSGEYWIAWDSYIFMKIEGIVDLDGDGDTETNMALHVGSNATARQVEINLPQSDIITIPIDLQSIFTESNVIFDIQNNPQIHSLSQLDLAEFLMDNLSKTISI